MAGILQRQVLSDTGTSFANVRLIPAYRHMIVGVAGRSGASREIIPAGPEATPCRLDAVADSTPRFHHHAGAPTPCLHTGFLARRKPEDRTGTVKANATINVATYLDGIFQHPIDAQVFELTLLADTTGHIFLQKGASSLRLGRLDPLLVSSGQAGAKEGTQKAFGWETIRYRPTITDLRIAGSTYRFFLAPCCLSADGTWQERPLLVAGLVRKSTFMLKGLQLSLTLLTGFSALLIFALLGWPFLKLRLLGERQRILPSDGLILGVSCLLAAALATIFALNLFAYQRYRVDRDRELEELAGQISSNYRWEIRQGYNQLGLLAQWADRSRAKPYPPGNVLGVLPDTLRPFPFFESFAEVDSHGKQVRKWTIDRWVQPPIPVRDRRYFKDALAERMWMVPVDSQESPGALGPADRERYALESVRSWTTGRRQVVLARRHREWPVAAIALYMISVIGTTLPADMGFAIVDDEGTVLLHADESRNLEENFFVEADQNRTLRSTVLAHAGGFLSVNYGGREVRAFVSPIPDLPLTVIAFGDKQPGRVTSAEWITSSSYLMGLYLVLLLFLVAGILLFEPTTRLAGLWPDRRLCRVYLRLIVIQLLLVVVFGWAIVQMDRSSLLLTGVLLPLLVIVLAALRLQGEGRVSSITRSHPGQAVALVSGLIITTAAVAAIVWRSDTSFSFKFLTIVLTGGAVVLAFAPPTILADRLRLPLASTYRSVAFLFLLLIGALPAAAFFKVAYSAHSEALVKHRQLQFARALEARRTRLESRLVDSLGSGKSEVLRRRLCLPEDQDRLCTLDVYAAAGGLTVVPDAGGKPRNIGGDLVGHLLSPYRAETSVEWRSLLADSTRDHSRWWSVAANDLLLHYSPHASRSSITIRAALPSLRPEGGQWIALGLLGLVVAVILWYIVRFVSSHLFLIEVTDPVLVTTGNRLTEWGDANLLVLCRNCAEEDALVFPSDFVAIDVRSLAVPPGALVPDVSGFTLGGKPVVLRHFEHERQNLEVAAAKLRLVDSLVRNGAPTVVVVESRAPDGSPLGLGREWSERVTFKDGSDETRVVLESFVLVDSTRWSTSDDPIPSRRWIDREHRAGGAKGLIEEECRGDANLAGVWQGLEHGLAQAGGRGSTRREMLEILGERAEPYYDAIWASCRQAERVVLKHLATDGLVNEKDRRVLRRLLARGLVRREPHFRVMNESFREYLVRHPEVAEPESGPISQSVWDGVKGPLLAVVATGILVLFVTQQALFNATTTVIMGLSTGIPAFAKVIGMLGGRSQAPTTG